MYERSCVGDEVSYCKMLKLKLKLKLVDKEKEKIEVEFTEQ